MKIRDILLTVAIVGLLAGAIFLPHSKPAAATGNTGKVDVRPPAPETAATQNHN